MLNLSLINEYDKIVVALSGGADSVALLHALKTSNLNIEIFACHLNHKTRGEESTRDLEFSKSQCKSLNIPFYFEEIEINIDKKLGFEATARNIRYDFYNRAIKNFNATKLATAHNADDNLETILLNLCRGTGIDGVCGIPHKRDNIIRPILHKTRDEIEEYLTKIEANFITDSSNNTDKYARNKIRHHCIPILKEINLNAVKNATNLSENLTKTNDYLNNEANFQYNKLVTKKSNSYIINSKNLTDLDQVISFKIIKKITKNLDKNLTNNTFNEILSLSKSTNPSAKLEKEFTVIREYDNLVFRSTKQQEKIELQITDENITITTNMLDNLNISYPISKSKIDFETLVLRKREIGDELKTKSGTKTLKKAFIDKKIPQNIREYIPIICDKSGIISVCYFNIDQNRETKEKDYKINFRSTNNEK